MKSFLRSLPGTVLFGALLVFLDVTGSAALRAQPLGPEARRVVELLDKIEKETSSGPGLISRKEMVTEVELNAYIAYRIASEKEEIMKELELKLLPNNRIEGRVLIDLSGKKLPTGLRPKMDILFSGTLRALDRKVRLELDAFYLEKQKIPPAFLDLIIALVSRLEGSDPWKLDDWHALPYGIKEMWTEKGRISVGY
jgi:hypothetical protein